MEFDTKQYACSPCLICNENRLLTVQGFSALPRITSDCRAFDAGGELAVCENCATVQKIPNARWLSEIEFIYQNYAAYSLADGEEQLVLDPQSGQPRKRSEVIMQALRNTGELAHVTQAIDVGCGHGVTMMAMASAFPDWKLFGHELDESKKVVLQRIMGFQRLYTGDLADIDETFDFISMIHSLEHFVDPLETLRLLKRIFNVSGRLFIQVCNVEENPFDLLVADHLTHFSPETLAFAVNQAGYTVSCVTNVWVRKEISLLAVTSGVGNIHMKAPHAAKEALESIAASVAWLKSMMHTANSSAREASSFGVFGTSIAGTWLAIALGDRVEFFVDEDPSRIGKEYMGRPVFAPQSVAHGATVFLALAPTLAEAISDRLSPLGLKLVVPPGVNA